MTWKMAIMKYLRVNSCFSLLINSQRGKYILRYSPQFKLSSKSIQNRKSVGVCYEDWWAVPTLPISAGPEHEQQKMLGSKQVWEVERHINTSLLSSYNFYLNFAHQKTKHNTLARFKMKKKKKKLSIMPPIASTLPRPIKQITGLYVLVGYRFQGGHPTETFVGQLVLE